MISFARTVGVKAEIYVMESNGKRQRRLDNTPVSNTKPAWSPQGDKIAFVNKPDQDTKVYRIYTIGTNGQNKDLLIETEASEIRKNQLVPGWQKMLFVYYGGVIQEIRTLDMITREVNSINTNSKVVGVDNAVWAPFRQDDCLFSFSSTPTDRHTPLPLWHILNRCRCR